MVFCPRVQGDWTKNGLELSCNLIIDLYNEYDALFLIFEIKIQVEQCKMPSLMTVPLQWL
jgi:hypothetical protein